MSHIILQANSSHPFPLADESIQCCITSPPYYGLRDYNVDGQIGHERNHDCSSWATGASPCGECYVCTMRVVCSEVFRVLKRDGIFWLNIGDSYAGGGVHDGSGKIQKSNLGSTNSFVQLKSSLRNKNLMGVPWRVALALQADGWYLRSDIIWAKTNGMVESVRDRCTKAHEYIFMLTKSATYYYDYDAAQEPGVDKTGAGVFSISEKYRNDSFKDMTGMRSHNGRGWKATGFRNRRTVWRIPVSSYKGAHYATFPTRLVEPCILIGTRPDDVVLDPFSGAGTTALVAIRHHRRYIGLELGAEAIALSTERLQAPIQISLL